MATSTPCSAAQTKEQMTASARKMSLVPLRVLALMTASFTFGAMPTMPWPFASAAMMPATFVPWPESSFQAAGSRFGAPPTQETLREGSTLSFRSGWLASTPVSMTPTRTFGLPPVIACASGALMRCAYHWSGENVSPLEDRRARQPVAVPVPAPARSGRDDAADGGDALRRCGSGRGLPRSPGSLGLRDDDVDLRVRRDDRAAGLRDVVPRAPDAPTVLGVQDDVPLGGSRARQRERERRRDREHDKSNGCDLAASFLSLLEPLPDGRRGALAVRTIRAPARECIPS